MLGKLKKRLKSVETKKEYGRPEPRLMQDIQANYNDLCAKAGACQYQVHVYSEELKQINEELRRVNNEAAHRQQLDREAQAKQAAENVKKEQESRNE